MSEIEQLDQILGGTALVALATSVDGQPDVRIMDVFYDAERHVLVFPTSSRSRKIAQFEANDKVAVTTIPQGPAPVVRITAGTVAKSERSIDEISATMIEHRAGFEHLLRAMGDTVVVYEIAFSEAVISEKGTITRVAL